MRIMDNRLTEESDMKDSVRKGYSSKEGNIIRVSSSHGLYLISVYIVIYDGQSDNIFRTRGLHGACNVYGLVWSDLS